jgi:hypothetical protein
VLTALRAHHQRHGAQHGATVEIPADRGAQIHIVATPEIDRQIADARAAFFAQRQQLITLHKEAWPPAAKEVTERQEGMGIPPAAARPQDRGTQSDNAPPTIADDRFASAPLDRAELAALARAPDFREASRLLGQFQQARVADGRLLHHDPQREPVLNRIFPPKEQVELGLQPTANEVTALQRNAAEQWRRTLAFVNEREKANAYWYSRALRSTAAAERLERTEQREERGQRDKIAAARAHLKERMDRHFADAPGRDSHSRGGGRDR